MTIGTAKPSDEELAMAKHHFIESHSIDQFYSAGAYERDALSLLDELFRTHDQLICVGGSGLYLKALWQGFDDMPSVKKGMREKLNHEFIQQGIDPLLAELKIKDPVYFEQVDRMNHQRVIRALEVIRSTGKPFSEYRKKEPASQRPFENVKIGLEMDREQLNERIDERMDQMIANGLFEEAEKLYPHKEMNALQTVGYKEIFDFMDGKYDREEAIRLLKRNSRRYAKRQMTWFKADPEIHWFEATASVDQILVSLHLS
jgi:tRNA dimethylallyltransferase